MTQVLRIQKVQNVTSLVYSVVGCLPLIRGISAHLISGGAAVKTVVAVERFGVRGLFESTFGMWKDLSSFVTELIKARVVMQEYPHDAKGIVTVAGQRRKFQHLSGRS